MQIFVPFYLLISSIIIVLLANKRREYGDCIIHFFSFSLLLFFVLVVGYRSFEHKGDTETYLYIFNYISNTDLLSANLTLRVESGFVFLTSFLSEIYVNNRFFLISISIIQACLWYICFYKWVERKNLMLCILIFISLFASYNLGANVLRQGIAIPIGFIGLKFLFDRKILTGIFLIFVGTLFHKSAMLIFVAWLIVFNRINIKNYFYVWFVFTISSIFGVFSGFINYIESEVDIYSHLVTEHAIERYQTGFRLDFWLFSFIPVILFFLVKKSERTNYSNMMKFYLTIFSFFILMFEIPYSDRIGLYNWMMIPIFYSTFIGSFKFNFMNSSACSAMFTTILGLLSFQLYYVMDVGRYLTYIF